VQDSESNTQSTPPRSADLTPDQGVRLWIDLMETCDQLLIAGLKAEVGPNGDWVAAYRQWHTDKAREHDAVILRMAQELQERLARHVS
jgi:hypothetical protein